jgi:hypothetical protein
MPHCLSANDDDMSVDWGAFEMRCGFCAPTRKYYKIPQTCGQFELIDPVMIISTALRERAAENGLMFYIN